MEQMCHKNSAILTLNYISLVFEIGRIFADHDFQLVVLTFFMTIGQVEPGWVINITHENVIIDNLFSYSNN